MKIYKAYKFRMYPNIEQQSKLNQFMGTSRFIYNLFLDKKNKLYETTKENYSLKDMKKDLLKLYGDYEWLKESDSTILRTTLDDLDRAYTNFFEKRASHPKFKSKNNHDTYRTTTIRSTYKGNNYSNIKVDLKNRTIKLPKLDKIKIRGYRNLSTFEDKKILNATISKEVDKYYVSLAVEEDIPTHKFKPTSIVGIDLGIKDLVITSNYEKYQNEKIIAKYEKRLKQKQKRLSKKQKGSKNYYKLKQKIARIHKKIRNARKYAIHKITKEITDTFDIIVTETLKVKNMIKNHNISKSLTDASLSEIIRQLEYKSKWKNKKMYKIDTYYASSQICNKCGYKNERIKDLSVREYECPKCKNQLDRDYNAAINIMYEGLKKYIESLA